MNNPEDIKNKFPKVGDLLIFTGVPEVYFPMLLPMGDYARENLQVGQPYKVVKVELASSWCPIWVEGHEEHMLSFRFFKFV
jgi:hypothetical protein